MTEKNSQLEEYLSRNYRYELHRDEEDRTYFAMHPDLDGCAAQGDTADEAISNLDSARAAWIGVRLEDNLPVPEPMPDELSGKVLLRMPTGLHAKLAKQASSQGASLNTWIVRVLSEHVAGYEAKWRIESVCHELETRIEKLNSVVEENAAKVYEGLLRSAVSPVSGQQESRFLHSPCIVYSSKTTSPGGWMFKEPDEEFGKEPGKEIEALLEQNLNALTMSLHGKSFFLQTSSIEPKQSDERSNRTQDKAV